MPFTVCCPVPVQPDALGGNAYKCTLHGRDQHFPRFIIFVLIGIGTVDLLHVDSLSLSIIATGTSVLNPLHVVGHIAYRTWTDKDKLKHHHTAIVIDSFTLMGRPSCETSESMPDPDDGDGTGAVDADDDFELYNDRPF